MALPSEAQRYVAAKLSIERRRIIEEYEKRDAEAVQDLITRGLFSSTVRVTMHLESRVNRAQALGGAHIDAYFAACEKSRHVPDAAEVDRLGGLVAESSREEEARAREILLGNLEQANLNSRSLNGQFEAAIKRKFDTLRQEFRAVLIARQFELGAELSRDTHRSSADPIGGGAETASTEATDRHGAKPVRPTKKAPGRPLGSDKKEDKRIADAWDTHAYATYAELAGTLGLKKSAVEKAVDRVRKRANRSRRAN